MAWDFVKLHDGNLYQLKVSVNLSGNPSKTIYFKDCTYYEFKLHKQ